MNRVEMRGLFWELVGQVSTYSRAPGSGSPAGPTADQLIYQAIMELVREARPVTCRALGTITLSTGTGVGPYSLPSDFMDYLDIEEPMTLAGYPLKQIMRGQAEQASAGIVATANDSPQYWYEMGVSTSTFARQVGFYPGPSEAGTVKVPYLRLPLTLTATGMQDSTEYPDLPPDYHQAPCYHAAWQFFQRKQEKIDKPIDQWAQLFTAAQSRLKSATKERLRATFQSAPPDYMGPAIENWMPV